MGVTSNPKLLPWHCHIRPCSAENPMWKVSLLSVNKNTCGVVLITIIWTQIKHAPPCYKFQVCRSSIGCFYQNAHSCMHKTVFCTHGSGFSWLSTPLSNLSTTLNWNLFLAAFKWNPAKISKVVVLNMLNCPAPYIFYHLLGYSEWEKGPDGNTWFSLRSILWCAKGTENWKS